MRTRADGCAAGATADIQRAQRVDELIRRNNSVRDALMRMVEAERTNEHLGQSAGIIAARDRFYKGAIARDVVAFPQEHQAPFELSDFADFHAKIEPPAMTTYRGYKIYKLRSAARGRSLLQALNILEHVKGFGTIIDSNSAIRQFEKDVHTSR
jgi:gamma-glutamyltranspeptidase